MLGKIEKARSLSGIGTELFLSQNLLIIINKNFKHSKGMDVKSLFGKSGKFFATNLINKMVGDSLIPKQFIRKVYSNTADFTKIKCLQKVFTDFIPDPWMKTQLKK